MAPVARTPGLREETARLTSWFSSLERQNHARELVQGLSLSEWDGIVTLSGDGLLFEVKGEHPNTEPWGTTRDQDPGSWSSPLGDERAPRPP